MVWITDATSKDTVEGSTVTCIPNPTRGWNPGDGVATAIADKKIPLGSKLSWKIRVLKGNDVFVGVTNTKEHYRERTSVVGLYYGGNTTDGRTVFCPNYGPWIKAHDIVGVTCDLSSSGRIKLGIDINGKSLGVIYDTDNSELGGDLYPSVIFTQEATVSFEDSNGDIPEIPVPIVPNGISGEWRLEKVTVNNAQVNPFMGGCRPPDPFKYELPIRLSLTGNNEGHSYTGTLSAFNNFPLTLTKDPEVKEYDSWKSVLIIDPSQSTLLEVPPEHQSRETQAKEIFQDCPLSLTSLGDVSIYIEGTSMKSMWTRVGIRYLDGCKRRPADLV